MINVNSNVKLTIESTPILEIQRNLSIRGSLAHLDVPYKIVCDMSKIPQEKHSLIIQTLMTR